MADLPSAVANVKIDDRKSKPKKPPKQKPEAKPANNAKVDKTPKEVGSVFDSGFLADVYKEKPLGSPNVEQIVTRFPPEPNGFLHIGHAKAITVNFGFASHYGGKCILRFDDTNPQKEKEEFYVSIEDMVRWLGFTPVRTTHSSDNFQRLYDLAEDLIKRDAAYVCHCQKSEIIAQRGGGETHGGARYACPHRDRPIEESLTEFRAMRDGKYQASEAGLRMKMDLTSPNPQMWDLFAYRIPAPDEDGKPKLHHRTASAWKIYPTYDFTHCLCDSFEDITHSLCTTEFEMSRQSYEWLCNKLEIYCPMQREYGRLNITGTVLSKRKIEDLIKYKHVRGWDDPRLFTLVALRRRGIPPGAILEFVNELGVSKAESNIEVVRFEQSIRKYLEFTVPRLMLVLDPIPVVIEGLPDDHVEMVEVPFSKDPSFGVNKVPFTKTVYIDRSDFREVDSPDYFRLAPGKTVGLMKVPFPITAISFEKDANSDKVTKILARYEIPPEGSKPVRPKTYIHWVAESAQHQSPVKTEVRVFHPLYKSANPNAAPGGHLTDIAEVSEEIYPNAMLDIGFRDLKARAPWPKTAGEANDSSMAARPETIRFQGMRVAYFTVDSDTTDDHLVLNRIVTLKEDAGKATK